MGMSVCCPASYMHTAIRTECDQEGIQPSEASVFVSQAQPYGVYRNVLIAETQSPGRTLPYLRMVGQITMVLPQDRCLCQTVCCLFGRFERGSSRANVGDLGTLQSPYLWVYLDSCCTRSVATPHEGGEPIIKAWAWNAWAGARADNGRRPSMLARRGSPKAGPSG